MKRNAWFFAAMIPLLLQNFLFSQTHYTINGKGSFVKYFMEHPLHNWDAVSQSASGTLDVKNDLSGSNLDIKIPVITFNSQNSSRDSHMAEAVESYIYPDVSFRSNNIIAAAVIKDGITAKNQWQIDGTLTFHGVSRTVSLPVNITMSDRSLIATGNFELKLSDYGIELPKLLLVPVKDWIKITFSITAETTGGSPL